MVIRDEFRERSLLAWTEGLQEVFPSGIPVSNEWNDVDSMASVLDKIGVRAQSNHMFFPMGGGHDLLGASPYREEAGCLALKVSDHLYEVVKPSMLLFEAFGSDLEWSYFRIECDKMPWTGVADEQEGATEEVVLISPGEYAPRAAWDENSYEGEGLPEDAKLIVRFVGSGSLVIFSKGSQYNLGQDAGRDAYDGRHNKRTSEQFRSYIERSAKASGAA